MRTFDMLNDDMSKETYVNIILARIGKEKLNFDLVRPNQYFDIREFQFRSNSECFVDCGAYVGDTIEQYLNEKDGVFEKIYAFEPCHRNCEALRKRLERINAEWALDEDRITVIEAGIGEKDTRMNMRNENNGTPSLGASFDGGKADGNGIDIYSIDSYFKDKKVSFIKADIESFERSMIKGAVSVIKRDRPKLAICIYHNATDMCKIALLLKEINPEYHFSVRQHYVEACETVLYAY